MQTTSSGSVRVFWPLGCEEVLEALRQRVPRLSALLPLRQVVLFGSYAQGRHTVASDIDLLVVYRGPAREDAFALVKRVLALHGLEPHVYAEADYEHVRPTLERMIQGGIPVEWA